MRTLYRELFKMKDKINYELYATVNRFTVLVILLASVIMAGLGIIFWTQMGNRQIGYQNQAYQRINSCIISVNPVVRTPEYVKSCYERVQGELNLTVKHYGDAE